MRARLIAFAAALALVGLTLTQFGAPAPAAFKVQNFDGFGSALGWSGRADALTIIRRLGLTSNLKVALDAGDAVSYTSGQPWLDRSGNGYDFNRGATSGAEASDPTFNGTAGNRSVSEYFSFDAGDYFTYDTSNEAWMENIHKDNAKFTIIIWGWVSGTGTMGLAGTFGGSTTAPGFYFGRLATNALRFVATDAAGAAVFGLNSAGAVPTSQWVMFSMSVDEAVGAGGAIQGMNLTFATATSTYTAPSALAAAYTLQIGSRGNGTLPLANTSRMAMVLAWEGVALTQAQIISVYYATRRRFGN